MKKPIFIISTEGKSPDQIKKEASKAYKKYRKIEKKVSKKTSVENI